jgi:nucleoid DNA-binding protein
VPAGVARIADAFAPKRSAHWQAAARLPSPCPAKAIAEQHGISQSQAHEIVQQLFDDIVETFLLDGRIELRNFGVFEVRRRKPRRARNPRTGETVQVPSKLFVGFKGGRELGQRLEQLKDAPGEAATGSAASAPSEVGR